MRSTAPFAVSAALRASRRWRRAPVRRTTAALASPTNGPDEFASVTSRVHIAKTPQTFEYDDDGNQTLVTTKTGTWCVTYNGENRPVRWERLNSSTPNSNTPSLITMSFDHQGRRRMYLETAADGSTNSLDRFTYDNYLCIARNRWQPDGTSVADRFTWNPTESVATRPLAFYQPNASPQLYAIDGNKNVSELVSSADGSISAHYEYAPFGEVILSSGDFALTNPFCFSSEYADDTLALEYYNYRHYEPVVGRWLQMDPIFEEGGVNIYSMVKNDPHIRSDSLGLGWTGIISPSGGTQSYSEPISQMVMLNDFGGRFEVSTRGSVTYTATSKSRAECVDGSDTPVKSSGEWNVKLLPPALSRKVVVSHGQVWQETTRWTVEEYLVYTVIDISVGKDGTKYKWSEEYCTCFKLTYGIASHGTAYVNNFGIVTAAIAVAAVGEEVVVAVPALIPTVQRTLETMADSLRSIPIPQF